jgi:predicted DNA-binding protein
MAKRKTYRNLYVGLTARDQERLGTLAEIDGKTKTELAREALTWYLEQRENEEHAERDGVYAKAIKEMTNRICGMLARQGTALGVLYEVTWRSLPDAESRAEFDSLVNQVKAKQRKRLDVDEKALAAKIAAVVKP